jgi:hypothetical protein
MCKTFTFRHPSNLIVSNLLTDASLSLTSLLFHSFAHLFPKGTIRDRGFWWQASASSTTRQILPKQNATRKSSTTFSQSYSHSGPVKKTREQNRRFAFILKCHTWHCTRLRWTTSGSSAGWEIWKMSEVSYKPSNRVLRIHVPLGPALKKKKKGNEQLADNEISYIWKFWHRT